VPQDHGFDPAFQEYTAGLTASIHTIIIIIKIIIMIIIIIIIIITIIIIIMRAVISHILNIARTLKVMS